jgi:uncharacterized membrane-anchored protein YhcB (DUF1043 family)
MSDLKDHPHFKSTTQLIEELARSRAELDHWKANHASMVELNGLLRDRPDLGDRAQRVTQLIEERDRLRATSTQQAEIIRSMTKEYASLRESAMRLLTCGRHEDMSFEQLLAAEGSECVLCLSISKKRVRDLLRETFEARTDVGDCQLSHLIRGIWPELWERITKELET